MQKRIGAFIIRDKKLLLVSGNGSEIYWSPGGRIEKGETPEQCLTRELDEEIGVKVKSARLYMHQTAEPRMFNNKQLPEIDNYYYLVETEGEIKPSNEIDSYLWIGKNDINSPHLRDFYKEIIIPKLVKEKLM